MNEEDNDDNREGSEFEILVNFQKTMRVNCGPEEWDKVRVYMGDGETVVEMIEVLNDKEDNSDNEDKDKNLCALNVNRK